MSEYTYISSSILACSCGGQLVQLPGSECVIPATRRPASTFFAISMFNSRDEPRLPVTNLSPGSFSTSAYRTTFSGYFALTSAENSARSTELLVEISKDHSFERGLCLRAHEVLLCSVPSSGLRRCPKLVTRFSPAYTIIRGLLSLPKARTSS